MEIIYFLSIPVARQHAVIEHGALELAVINAGAAPLPGAGKGDKFPIVPFPQRRPNREASIPFLVRRTRQKGQHPAELRAERNAVRLSIFFLSDESLRRHRLKNPLRQPHRRPEAAPGIDVPREEIRADAQNMLWIPKRFRPGKARAEGRVQQIAVGGVFGIPQQNRPNQLLEAAQPGVPFLPDLRIGEFLIGRVGMQLAIAQQHLPFQPDGILPMVVDEPIQRLQIAPRLRAGRTVRTADCAGLDCGIGEQLEECLAIGIVPFKERKLRLIRIRVGKQCLLRIGLLRAHRLHRALQEDSLLGIRGFLPAQQPGADGIQMLPILVRGDEHAQIVRRRALRLLRVAEQPRNRLHQRAVRLPHQQFFAVHPQIRRLQAQMTFDCGKVQLLRRGLLGNFERFLAREGALVRQHVHQRFALARPLQRNQQRLQKGVAVIGVYLRKQ